MARADCGVATTHVHRCANFTATVLADTAPRMQALRCALRAFRAVHSVFKVMLCDGIVSPCPADLAESGPVSCRGG